MYVFGNSEYAGFAFELNFAGRVCSELDLPGLCAKPGHHISNRSALIQPGEHEPSIREVFPHPQLLQGAYDEFNPGLAIPVHEGGVDIEEPAFFEGRY